MRWMVGLIAALWIAAPGFAQQKFPANAEVGIDAARYAKMLEAGAVYEQDG